MTVRPLVAGNWKMNGALESFEEFSKIAAGYDAALAEKIDMLVCPPAVLLAKFAEVKNIAVGAQNCHSAVSGAFTGDISAEMVADAGGTYVLVGHSERREGYGETDADVAAKAEAAWRAGIIAVVCIGESLEQREAGETIAVVTEQVTKSLPDASNSENTVVAYEPIWAIGTGKTPTADDVAEVHAALRKSLEERFGEDGSKIRLLYGGSVKPSNAAELLALPNVNGALVGGASLKAADFLGIAEVYKNF
ncbi:triose-phosphate isomerase [Pseudovibrio exalbescens]|uniref:triose-phosphate isomerase n=1 Tax=Pseudovibrio exalbescens TaxID=197461 RepID=UPI002366A451|nr:triose-phosphate isomerase [Pseudovibrio exalbescens]MDD7911687.1 triose-phosphate isomerase [Pseudovibrio exalbescens]